MLRTLLAELEITLAIAGVGHHRELRPSALVRASASRAPEGAASRSRTGGVASHETPARPRPGAPAGWEGLLIARTHQAIR